MTNEPLDWTDAHHITPWTNGGTTSLNNLVLLCRHHQPTHPPPRRRLEDPPRPRRATRLHPSTRHRPAATPPTQPLPPTPMNPPPRQRPYPPPHPNLTPNALRHGHLQQEQRRTRPSRPIVSGLGWLVEPGDLAAGSGVSCPAARPAARAARIRLAPAMSCRQRGSPARRSRCSCTRVVARQQSMSSCPHVVALNHARRSWSASACATFRTIGLCRRCGSLTGDTARRRCYRCRRNRSRWCEP
ncbi:HNH endonuclease signature motif containing protein [Paractinoplanes durhamensis]|uniref:HNH endonuclease signature motif containing protein n=1 Tax=Paractinoplanes durhamensis TaxID=113563 RepID=UPI001EF18F6D|nr:HNH endonuclease signature motif containing protein [Actinoplanes durhamensis]